jgi:hypothetical protein
MNDKLKSGAQEPYMTRSQLVRAHFELYRDLYWSQEMEPKLRELNSSPDAMRHYRQAWDVFIEARDWQHWREDETRRCSNEELRAEIGVFKAELKSLDMRRTAHERADTGHPSFGDILNGNIGQPAAEPAHAQTRSMGR